MSKIAAIWARVSTEGQGETSLTDQIKEVKAMLESRGYTVPPERILSVAWSSPELSSCPEYDKLKDWVMGREIEAVGVFNRDRLVAEGIGRLVFIKLCKDKGVELIPCHGNALADGRDGELIAFIEGWAREGEVELKQTRSRFGLRNKAKNRRLPISRHREYGYDWQGDRRLVPNEDWPTLSLIFDLLRKGYTYRGMIREFENRTIPSPAGNPVWSLSTLREIARNPLYAGRYYALKRQAVEPVKRAPYSKRQYGKTSHRYLSLDEGVYLPEVEIVNPPTTWEEQPQLLRQAKLRQTLSKRNAKRDYMLRGLIFCDTHLGKRGQPLRYNGSAFNGSYGYRCPIGGCSKPKLNGPIIEAWVKRETKVLLATAELEDGYFEAMAGTDSIKATEESLRQELLSLEGKHNRSINAEAVLEERSLLGKVDTEVYERIKLRFRAERQWTADRRDEILGQLKQLSRQAEAEDVLEKLYRKFWRRFQTLSNSEWRDLLLLLNVEVHVKPASSLTDQDHWIPGDFSRIENIWRDIEKNKFRWTHTEATDTIIEVRFGVPLGHIEPRKVRDCVLPTLVGRTGLEPVTP